MVDWQQLHQAHHLFAVETTNSLLEHLHVDTGDVGGEDTSVAVSRIIWAARSAEVEASALNELHTYVGPRWPKLLLLGDVRHDYRRLSQVRAIAEAALDDPAPALTPFPATSGHFLLRVVDPLAARGDFGIINANDVDAAQAAWKLLGCPPAIALGKNAWKTTNEWARGVVPHPQFIRRFASGFAGAYAEIIAKTVRDGGDNLGWRPQGSWFDHTKSTDSSQTPA